MSACGVIEVANGPSCRHFALLFGRALRVALAQHGASARVASFVLRGFLNPLVDERLRRDPEVPALLREVERRAAGPM